MTPEETKACAQAIADHWAGLGQTLVELEDRVWRVVAEDGMTYRIHAPQTEFPVFEDSGRPCGSTKSDNWRVRCLTDAPDGWFEVTPEGEFQGVSSVYMVPGWPT